MGFQKKNIASRSEKVDFFESYRFLRQCLLNTKKISKIFIEIKKKTKMKSNYLLVSLLIFTLFLRSDSNEDCDKKTTYRGTWYLGFDSEILNWACGRGCTGTPACGKKKCGNVDDMCYCDCDNGDRCEISALGYKWNGGIKLANGSYALNGTKGDGRHYDCR